MQKSERFKYSGLVLTIQQCRGVGGAKYPPGRCSVTHSPTTSERTPLPVEGPRKDRLGRRSCPGPDRTEAVETLLTGLVDLFPRVSQTNLSAKSLRTTPGPTHDTPEGWSTYTPLLSPLNSSGLDHVPGVRPFGAGRDDGKD